MPELSNRDKVSEKTAFIKRNCALCQGRSRLRPVEEERSKARSGLKNLVVFFQDEYNHLRKTDADAGAITKALENKRLCMDLLDECDSCDNEIDRVNRGLNKLRK